MATATILARNACTSLEQGAYVLVPPLMNNINEDTNNSNMQCMHIRTPLLPPITTHRNPPAASKCQWKNVGRLISYSDTDDSARSKTHPCFLFSSVMARWRQTLKNFSLHLLIPSPYVLMYYGLSLTTEHLIVRQGAIGSWH